MIFLLENYKGACLLPLGMLLDVVSCRITLPHHLSAWPQIPFHGIP